MPRDRMSKDEEERAGRVFESFTRDEYSESDMHKVLDNEENIMSKMKNASLRGFINEVKTFFEMLQAFFTKKYTGLKLKDAAIILGTLVYVLTPIDIIPDFIPVVGYMDDAAIVALCCKAMADVVKDYEEWKKTHPKEKR